MIGEVERDPSIALADRVDACPDDLAGGAERVEVRRFVAVDSLRENFGFQDRRRHCRALQRFDDFEQTFQATALFRDQLPAGDEARVGGGVDRLDFLAQLRQRAHANRSQHFHLAPLALRSAGTELALDEPAALDETLQRRRYDRDAEAIAPRDVRRCERAVRAREAEHEIAGGIGDRLEVAVGQTLRERDAEGIAITACVLDGDEALLARDRDLDDAPRLRQLAGRLSRIDERSCCDFVER